MTQYAFFYDQARCVSCKTCEIQCKDWNNLPPGPGKWLRMFEWEKGAFPEVRLHTLFAPCYHCENPVCVDACPVHAIYKEAKYGAVLVDQERCRGLRVCIKACPYGAVTYRSDALDEKAQKCTMCVDLLEQGKIPICVASCPMRALDFGTLEDMVKKYGNRRQLEDMPSPDLKPAIIFKPMDPKKQLVPYPVDKVRRLHKQRMGLPDVFASEQDLTVLPPGLVSRSKLIMQAKNTAEEMRTTVNDD